MFISHKSNVLQTVHETEWQCRRNVKGLDKSEYWTWLDSVTTVTGTAPDEVSTVDLSGETGYVIVECTDEDVQERLNQLGDYQSDSPDTGTIYNIKYYVAKRDSEIVDVEAHTIAAHTDEDGNDVAEEDVATTYVQTHFIGQDNTKDARLLADEWTQIRRERTRLLAETDHLALSDQTLTAGMTTHRQKLRDIPTAQGSATKYSEITWPTKP
jgi:hypothetical protein